MTQTSYKKLNRDVIKYIAVIAMLLNHIAHVFLQSKTVLYTAFVNIGYFTAITMCFFLVEGYEYTSSKKKYAMRLLVFAIISQIPYMMVFRCIQFNMLFTLLFCLVFIWTKQNITNHFLKLCIYCILVILCCFSDWSVAALLFVNSFYGKTNNRTELQRAWVYNIAVIWVFNAFVFGNCNSVESLVSSLLSVVAPVISSILIMFFYNGKKSEKFTVFSKWFFYLFYPAHIIVLLIIKQLIV